MKSYAHLYLAIAASEWPKLNHYAIKKFEATELLKFAFDVSIGFIVTVELTSI